MIIACALILSYGCSANESVEVKSVDILVPTQAPTPTLTETPTPEPTPTPLPERECDFRFGVWGDSRETIRAYEGAALSNYVGDQSDDDISYYSVELLGYDFIAGYKFDDDKLCEGVYYFDEVHSQGHYYITVYDKLKASLTSKYGEPDKDSIKELNRLAKYSDTHGQALSLGYIGYITEWDLEDTTISMVMGSDNFATDIEFGIVYYNKNYTEPIDTYGL